MANYLDFGLTPAVPFLMVYAMDRSDEMRLSLKAAATLEILYLLILTAGTFSGGLVFGVDAENHYAREQGFWLYMLMYGGGIQYLMFNMLKMTQTYQNC